MNTQDKKDTVQLYKSLIEDKKFIDQVSDKIEYINSAILYVLSFKKDSSTLSRRLEESTMRVQESVIGLLYVDNSVRSEELFVDVLRTLQYMKSLLKLSVAARENTSDMVKNVIHAIDETVPFVVEAQSSQKTFPEMQIFSESISTSVYQQKHAVHSEARANPVQQQPVVNSGVVKSKTTRSKRATIPAGDISSDAYLVHSQLTDRAERIKTVLAAKPDASVREIADIITDVGEKTIQRELNKLIEQGQVERQGKRRWSTYSVVK